MKTLFGSVKGLSFVIAKANKKETTMNSTWGKVLVSAAVVVLTQVACTVAQRAMDHALERMRDNELDNRKA